MAPISGHARGYATESGRGLANTVAAQAWDENGIGWLKRLTAHMRSDETAASSPADTGDNHTLPPPGEAAPAHEAAEPPPAAVDSAPGVAEPASQAAEPAPEVAPSSRPPAPAGNGAAPPRSKWLFPAGLPDLTLSPEAVPDWPDGREHPLPDPQDPEDERL
jgi:hypothetical protein